MTSNPPAGQSPGAPAAAFCKRPGCGNPLPAQDRGRSRQFCSSDCARRYHNDARTPAPAAQQLPADLAADPLAALDAVIRQAAVLTRAAREQAAGLDPARVRAQIADAEAARRRAEAAAVTAGARADEAAAEAEAMAEALDTARQDTQAAQARAQTAAAELEQARAGAAAQLSAAHAEAAEQASTAREQIARCTRERDDAIETARRAEAEAVRARQAEHSARNQTENLRADADRERGALREQHQAQLDAVIALITAERARAERAEAQLDAERADRRHLTSALTATANANGNGNGNGNGKLPRAAAGKAGGQ